MDVEYEFLNGKLEASLTGPVKSSNYRTRYAGAMEVRPPYSLSHSLSDQH